MEEPRKLKGHKASTTCCIASQNRPGLIATADEVNPFPYSISLSISRTFFFVSLDAQMKHRSWGVVLTAESWILWLKRLNFYWKCITFDCCFFIFFLGNNRMVVCAGSIWGAKIKSLPWMLEMVTQFHQYVSSQVCIFFFLHWFFLFNWFCVIKQNN